MAVSSKDKRILFPKGFQKLFLSKVEKKLKSDNKILAKYAGVSIRTITDWKKERFSLSEYAAKRFSRLSGVSIPKSTREMDAFWYVKKGASKGGKAVYAKYGVIGGNPQKRKIAWRQWWEREGKTKSIPILFPKEIKKPKKSEKLAELVGILLGDGGISKYQVVITLNFNTDKEYGVYVIHLIKDLFGVTPQTRKVKNTLAFTIAVSRIKLVQFCVHNLGLKEGNKTRQQVNIPLWIRKNKKFQIACVRGLMDTDGSVFTHCYSVRKKEYRYKKINYVSASKPLLHSVHMILKNNGIRVRISRERYLWIDSVADVKNYFRIFKTSNPKHLKRYKE